MYGNNVLSLSGNLISFSNTCKKHNIKIYMFLVKVRSNESQGQT